jgi:GT2 family glycosyltransferase
VIKAAVVILNYNGASLLQKFLPSVIANTPSWCSVIVADNASTDNSLSVLQQHFPDVQCVEMQQNLGFAGGYNHALQQVDAEYYILLNSDIEVTPQWVEPIIEFMIQHADVAACQPKILAYNQKDFFEHAGACGGYIDYLGFPFCRGRIFNSLEKDENQYTDNKEIFWATGAAMFIRSNVFKATGGFDADFFAHMEEIDLCWRMKHCGYKLYCIPASKVYHVGGGTLHKNNPKKTYLNFRNNLMMLLKNLPSGSRFSVFVKRLFLDKLAVIKFFVSGNYKDAWAVYRAYFYVMLYFKIIMRKRREIKNLNSGASCIFEKSIVSEHFFRGKKKFTELNQDYFSK